MKVVKVTRSWRVWSHGHKVALRFNGWTKEAGQVEELCRQRIGFSGWRGDGPWTSWYGKSNGRNEPRPYFISFHNEADATMILLVASAS